MGGFYQVGNAGSNLCILPLSPVFLVDTGDVAIETRVAVTPMDASDDAYAGIVWGYDPISGTEVYSMKANVASLDQPGLMADGNTKAKFDYFKAENTL